MRRRSRVAEACSSNYPTQLLHGGSSLRRSIAAAEIVFDLLTQTGQAAYAASRLWDSQDPDRVAESGQKGRWNGCQGGGEEGECGDGGREGGSGGTAGDAPD